jgi:hypothetical protein
MIRNLILRQPSSLSRPRLASLAGLRPCPRLAEQSSAASPNRTGRETQQGRCLGTVVSRPTACERLPFPERGIDECLRLAGRLTDTPWRRTSRAKVLAVAFVGTHVPLLGLIASSALTGSPNCHVLSLWWRSARRSPAGLPPAPRSRRCVTRRLDRRGPRALCRPSRSARPFVAGSPTARAGCRRACRKRPSGSNGASARSSAPPASVP